MIGDVAVIKLAANHLELKLVKDYTARTNTIRGIKIQVDFRTRDWDALAKTVVFNSKNISEPILVQMKEGEDFVDIPWEIMAISSDSKADKKYTVGVFGVSAGGAQLPTNTLELTMLDGCYSEGVAPTPPTPDVFSQISAIQQDTFNIAQSVRNDADAGVFDGDPGLSAYEIWLNNGHEGTEEDFLSYLRYEELAEEFSEYADAQGQITDELRAIIAQNKDAISEEAARATGAEGVLSGRIEALEAIDHDAYKAYADQAESDAVATAQELINEHISAANTRIDSLSAAHASLNTLISNNAKAISAESGFRNLAIDAVTTGYQAADSAINAKIGGGFDANNTVADAIESAKIDAQNRDSAVLVNANLAIAEEKGRAELAENALGNRIDGLEEDINNFAAVIDVAELPEEDVVEDATYRLLLAKFFMDGTERGDSVCHVVESLPDENEAEAVLYEHDYGYGFVGYFSLEDYELYGYFSRDVIDMLSPYISDLPDWLVNIFAKPGWYTLNDIMDNFGGSISITWNGCVFNLEDTLVEGLCLYIYSEYFNRIEDVWISSNVASVGRPSIGVGAEVFNSPLANVAAGTASHAEGKETEAIGDLSHAEGYQTIAAERVAHAEGEGSEAHGWVSHAEGYHTFANGHYSHSGGYETRANGLGSFASGMGTIASAEGQHAIGTYNLANPAAVLVVGNGTKAGPNGAETRKNAFVVNKDGSAEISGKTTIGGDVLSKGDFYQQKTAMMNGALQTTNYKLVNEDDLKKHYVTAGAMGNVGTRSTAEGEANIARGYVAHAEGNGVWATGTYSHAEGTTTRATGDVSHAEGNGSQAIGAISHAEGLGTQAKGVCSHTEGSNTTAEGESAHAEGYQTFANGKCAHAEGEGSEAIGNHSHAEGVSTHAEGLVAHAEGRDTYAIGECSHAEGDNTTAEGAFSHTEGRDTHTAPEAGWAHAEGAETQALANLTHAEGYGTIAGSMCQHAQGMYNVEDTDQKYLHIVGNGQDDENRSNAHTVDWNGNGWFKGDVKVGGDSQYDPNATKLATTSAVANALTGRQSGKWIRLEDVSPLEHNLDVKVHSKNIFDKNAWTSPIGEGEVNGAACIKIKEGMSTYLIPGTSSDVYTLTIKMYRLTNLDVVTNLQARRPNEGAINLSVNFMTGDTRTCTVYGGDEIFFNGHSYDIAVDLTVTQLELGEEATEFVPPVSEPSMFKMIAHGKNFADVESMRNHNNWKTDIGYPYYQIYVGAGKTVTISEKNALITGEQMSVVATGEESKKGMMQGVHIYHPSVQNLCNNVVTITSESGYIYITIDYIGRVQSEAMSRLIFDNDLQIEIGSERTEYEPYVPPVEYTVEADGSVMGVKSIYPTTTLITDTDGMSLDCVYNRDLNKAFAELYNVIISLGGNI